MATPEQFARDLNRIVNGIEPNLAAASRRILGQLLEDVVLGTPVDKGVARSNWRVSVDSPVTTPIQAYSPGSKLGIGERANANAAINAGRVALRAITPGTLPSQIFIGNAVGYINDLRRGSSRQQSVDWVEIALTKAAKSFRLTNLLSRGANRG